MSNTHEYVVFDRAKLDRALAMKWPAFDRAYPDWGQWESARDFLVNFGLGEEQIELADEILAHMTVLATLRLNDDPFHFLWAILDMKGLSDFGVEIAKGDYTYADEIVSCAGAGFVRGELSLASLTAVYHLHASWVDPAKILLPYVAKDVQKRPRPPAMIPRMPDMMTDFGDGIGVYQSRQVIRFLIRAWQEEWPLQCAEQKPGNATTIRSCEAAGKLAAALQVSRLSRPCMFRWYES